MEDKSTPRKWDWEPCGQLENRIFATDPGPEKDFTIGFVRDADTQTRDANTLLIVRAVNSYDAMREALKAALYGMDELIRSYNYTHVVRGQAGGQRKITADELSAADEAGAQYREARAKVEAALAASEKD